MASSSEECLEDVSKLEPIVMLALSRLQKGSKCSRSKRGKTQGVKSAEVVEYLSTNYCYLDGDVESQVITALLSCVKSGIICALDNGRFRLIGPRSQSMVSHCMTRKSHGPKCGCLEVINTLTKNLSSICCSLKSKKPPKKSKMKRKYFLRRNSASKPKSAGSGRRKVACDPGERRATRSTCAKDADEAMPDDDDADDGDSDFKCNYCLEVHPPALEDSRRTRSCKKCFVPGTIYGVPSDKFSAREEVM